MQHCEERERERAVIQHEIPQIQTAQILENDILDQGVVVSELAIGVRGDDLIKLGDDELVFYTRDSVAAGVKLGQELTSLQELEA